MQLTPNSMTVLELEGETLGELRRAVDNGWSVAIMLEVEPDGSPAVKVKADNGRWSPPLEVAARVERLYE